MPPHFEWHEWNMNAGDAIETWFTSYAYLVTLQWACVLHAHVYGAHAIIKIGMVKYSNGLMGTPADSNLRK